MRINPVYSYQNYSQKQKNRTNTSPVIIAPCKNNEVAFAGNFFKRLGSKIDKHLTSILAKAKNLPGSYDDEFHKLLNQTLDGDGVPLVGNLRDETISSSKEHKKAIEKALSSLPKEDGMSRSFLEEALEVINEKMNSKKKV